MPTTSQAVPTASVTGLSAMTTSQALSVPSPPTTAVSGTSTPRNLKLNLGFQPRSASGSRLRSQITAAWAIVNESMAPNE